MSWTDGYVSDVRYPAFFYKEMQPLWLSTVANFQGFGAPDPDAPFALCELGCGVGINLLVSAACHPQAQFVGVDFNEAHLLLAREAAAQCGLDNVEFVHADFAAFAQGNERQFDYMTCHGVWSWIAPEFRGALLECISHSLKKHGLFYLHYMSHPGSTELLPLQHLLNLCAHHMRGASPRKAQTGMMLLRQLVQGGLYANRPDMLRHLAAMAKRDPADLAHEFLTDHWQPQHSAHLHQTVSATGLSLLGSADVFNNLDPSLSIPGKLQDLIRRTAAPALAETLKDMARNSHQRMDLFQKEPRRLIAHVPGNRPGETNFRLMPGAPAKGPVTFDTSIGSVTGSEAALTPLLERLGTGAAPVSDLSRLPVFAGDIGALLQSLQLLMMQQMAHPSAPVSPTAKERTERLSQWFDNHGIALSIVADCATAVPRPAA